MEPVIGSSCKKCHLERWSILCEMTLTSNPLVLVDKGMMFHTTEQRPGKRRK